jgi:hypothetical protein
MDKIRGPGAIRGIQAAFAAILLAPCVYAQTAGGGSAVAHLKQVTGNVLVSRESGLAAADDAVPLTKGMRVITTANSEATVVYDNGCEVKLKQNQRFEVVFDKPCAALVTQAESILLEPEGAALATTATTGLTALLLAPAFNAGVAGVTAILLSRQGTQVSPS